MLSTVLRTQVRFGLLQAARVAAPATSRALSALVASRAAFAPAATTTARLAVRQFSSSTIASYDGPERPRNPPSDTLFVGNVPWNATEEELTDLFSEFGELEGPIRMPIGFDGRSRGFAHISFKDQASAMTAVDSAAQEPMHLNGRDLVLDYAQNKSANNPSAAPSNKIYFSNFEQGEAALRELLVEHEADILSVFVLRDGNTGAALNNGFVELTDVSTAQRVIDQFNGTELESGAKLVMNFARPKKERSDRGPSGGDRRGGDRRGGGGGGGNHYSGRSFESRGRRDY